MSDRIMVTACRGGLDEESSDAEVGAGSVRRSLNYEQVSSGGYRRIGGSVKWAGSNNTPDRALVTVVEVANYLELDPGACLVNDTNATMFKSSASDTHANPLFYIGRVNSLLIVAEKQEATSFFTVGETWPNYLATVIEENPPTTEFESDLIASQLSEFGLELAPQPGGEGRIEFITNIGSHLICGRNSPDGLVISRSVISGRRGRWLDHSTKPTIAEGGTWDSYNYTFAGDQESSFLVNGVSNPLILTITTVKENPVPDVAIFPTNVVVFQNHLFYGYENGSVIHSDLGDPESFTALGGGSEFATGFPITGFQVLPGNSLAIFGENQISILSGTSSADWTLQTHSDQMGAARGTIQNLPTTIFASKRGISTLAASDSYGDFSSKMLSHNFTPAYTRITRGSTLFSLVNHESSQYRLINSNGRGLYLTFSSNSLAGAMEVDLRHRISCVGSAEAPNSQVASNYFGTEDGWVHRMDQGDTLSGEPMDAFLEFPYSGHTSSRQKKRFKEVVLDMKGDNSVSLQITASYDKGRSFHQDAEPVEVEVIDGQSQKYRSTFLSRFLQYFQAIAYTTGTGTDQSLLIEHTNTSAHEIDSVTTHYTNRGQKR